MAAKLKEKERLEAVLREAEQEGEGLLEVIKGHRQQLTKTQTRIKEHLDAFSQVRHNNGLVWQPVPLQ